MLSKSMVSTKFMDARDSAELDGVHYFSHKLEVWRER